MTNITPINITPIIVAFIGLLSTIITVVLVPYIRAKTTAEQRAKAEQWAKIAVQAAEMIFNEKGMGAEKFAYVEAFLESKGIVLDKEILKVVIESAVLELKQAANAE